MATTSVMNPEQPPATLQKMLPIIIASTLGTAIEWYDFFLYGFLAATVFPQLFFPSLDPYTGVIAAFTTNFVGFVARPLGGAFFGWFGDRVGRKSTLVATLLLMGSSTMLMGVLPGYATVGLLAPIILAVLRFLQGVGLGGEWGGSILLSMEYGDDGRRCFWASWPQTGVSIGLALAALIVLLFKFLYPGSAFESIGWRIPFLLSTVLVILGLYIRLRILETPSFSRLKEEKHLSRAPFLEVMHYHWREILLCTLLRSGETAPFYIFTTFMLSYTVEDTMLNVRLLYTGFALSAMVGFFAMPTFAFLSDRVGRKLWFALGTILMGTFVFPYFLLLQTKNPILVVCAFVFSIGICVSWLYGPEAALIAEQFEIKLRYSGASLGYQLASVTAGGPAPIVAIYLLLHYKTFGGGFAAVFPSYVLIAIFIVFMSLISLISVLLLKNHE